jgi:hypothetical protein
MPPIRHECFPRLFRRGHHLLGCCVVACFAGRGPYTGGLPGVAAVLVMVPDGVAGDPMAEDLGSVLIPGEERGAGRGADIRSLSRRVCPARLRDWS